MATPRTKYPVFRHDLFKYVQHKSSRSQRSPIQDPDFRFVENGAARLRGRIVVNRSYRDRNKEWLEEPSFFNIVL